MYSGFLYNTIFAAVPLTVSKENTMKKEPDNSVHNHAFKVRTLGQIQEDNRK